MQLLPRSTLAFILLGLFFNLATPRSHDDWNTKSYPEEEFTTGIEAGPLSTIWGQLATVRFVTSRREFAASTGTVHITFFGTRATSDTHFLQEGFEAGATDSCDIQLTREIGQLERIKLQTNSSDGWLVASIWIDIGAMTYYLESTDAFLDYPDSGLAKQCWEEGDVHACSLANDPYGTLSELYEPQAPSRSNPPDFAHRAHTRNSAADVDGRLGRESIVLKVIDYIETLRDPYDLKETTRIDIDP